MELKAVDQQVKGFSECDYDDKSSRSWVLMSQLGQVFLGLLLSAAIFASLEWYSRNFEQPDKSWAFTQLNEDFYYPRPYVMSSARPGSSGINKLGYRGDLPAEIKPAGEYRIFILGGSVVFNGIPPFSDLLEERFHRQGSSQVQVFNFGAVSSVSRQDLVRLVTEVATYQPDLVIFYSGSNDIRSDFDERINSPHRHILYEINPLFSLSASNTPLLPTMALSSQFLRNHLQDWLIESFVSQRLHQLHRPIIEKFTASERRQLRIQALIQNLRLASAFATAAGSRMLAIAHPMAKRKDGDGDINLVDELVTAAKRQGFPIVDFGGIFDREPEVKFRDDIHHDQNGMRVVAERMFELTRPLLAQPTLNRHEAMAELIPEATFFFSGKAE